jgi:hypothetical protein
VRRLLLASLILLALPALARRMGVEEPKRGKPRKHVNVTVAHRDHIHIGMTKAGAAGKTSFWRGHTG